MALCSSIIFFCLFFLARVMSHTLGANADKYQLLIPRLVPGLLHIFSNALVKSTNHAYNDPLPHRTQKEAMIIVDFTQLSAKESKVMKK